MEGIEIYGLLGGARGELEDESEEGFSGGFGTKVTVWKKDAWSWGALAQFTATKFEFDDRGLVEDIFVSGDVDLTLYEIQIATGPVWQINKCVSVYGGPFLHFITGSAEGTISIDGTEFDGSADLEQDSVVGNFIGTQVKLLENLKASAEFQATGSGYGIGGQLVFAF